MTNKPYPITHKCRFCNGEFDYLDTIVKHIETKHGMKL